MSSNRPVSPVKAITPAAEYFLFRYKMENNLFEGNIGIVPPHIQLKSLENKALAVVAANTGKATTAAERYFAQKHSMQKMSLMNNVGIVPPHFHAAALAKHETDAMGDAKAAVEMLRNASQVERKVQLSS